MAKHSGYLCRKALRNGVRECNGEDLLTKCENLSKKLGVRNITKGFHHKETIKESLERKR